MEKLIERFAQQMQIELDNNQHKNRNIEDYIGITNKIADLEYHKAKLMLAIRTGNKRSAKEYIADCGNILMSIGCELGLYIEDSKDDRKCSELETSIFKIIPLEEAKISKLTENL